ncbi:MAG: HAD family hydrolase [Balneolaceae bacterium]|nr:MAG: HAD family hydrolase [Balneolaceae bacterium]
MAQPLTHNITLCVHCGDSCPDGHAVKNDLDFCCDGCAMVYELLSENGLDAYYKIGDATPGISRRKSARSARYEYLDDAGVREKLLTFTDGRKSTITFSLPQIHCSSCIWLLENINRLDPGIIRSEVSFTRREASVTFDESKTTLRKVAELLDRIGYEPDLRLDSAVRRQTTPGDRDFYIKVGLAGFAFGNIMLFSLPEYLSGPAGLDAQFNHLFGYLNLIIAIPVFLYSASVFYRSAWAGVRQRQWNMDIAISIGIVAMFGRSTWEILSGFGVGYMDSFAMLVFFLLVGKLFQRKTFERLSFDRDYRSYFPLSVIVKKRDEEKSIPATSLETGDLIVLRHGELLPADSRLMSPGTRIDYSFVTGESDEVPAVKGDLIYAGGRIVGGSAELVVTKPVSQSYLTQLWNRGEFKTEKSDTIRSISNRFSRYFSPAVLLIAITAALYWLPSSPATAINAFTAVLIIACPCALALSAPFTLGWVTGILGRNKFYVKNSDVIENMASSDTIVFDKTGTLTFPMEARVRYLGSPLSDAWQEHLSAGLRQSTHPMSRAILRFLDHRGTQHPDFFEEIPGSGLRFRFGDETYEIGSAGFIEGAVDKIPENRDGRSRSYISRNGKYLGFFEVSGSYRPGLNGLIERLRERFSLHLLSGDGPGEREALLPLFRDASRMHFEKNPEQKLEYVRELAGSGHVLMIGDGLNDAGALRASTVGVAVTDDTGTFTPSSDAIMHASVIDKLDTFINFTRYGKTVIKISFALSILYNIIGLAYAVTGTLSPLICAIIMPVSSVTVIVFTTLATNLIARRTGLV